MPRRSERWIGFCIVVLILARPDEVLAAKEQSGFNGVLVTAAQTTSARLRDLKHEGCHAVVLALVGEPESSDNDAARRIRKAGLDLYYWIEIAHNPSLADVHPEWMASIQTHPE